MGVKVNFLAVQAPEDGSWITPGKRVTQALCWHWWDQGGCGSTGGQVSIQEPGTREGRSSQGAGSQIRVFVLELPIQGEAPLFSIVGQEGGQRIDLAER